MRRWDRAELAYRALDTELAAGSLAILSLLCRGQKRAPEPQRRNSLDSDPPHWADAKADEERDAREAMVKEVEEKGYEPDGDEHTRMTIVTDLSTTTTSHGTSELSLSMHHLPAEDIMLVDGL